MPAVHTTPQLRPQRACEKGEDSPTSGEPACTGMQETWLSLLAMSLANSIRSGPLHPRRLSHVFCIGRGLQAGGCLSRQGPSPGTISQVPPPLAGAVLEKAGLSKMHLPPKQQEE